MSEVKIFWDPSGFELDSLGSKEFLRAADGDTPYVSMAIRMLSIDTPEVHYPGNQKPSKQDANLTQLAEWIKAGKAQIQDDLAQYLYPRLATGKAGTLQEQQGEKASEYYKDLVNEKLAREKGAKRNVFLHTSNQPFDDYGRLLAYIAPNYSSEELAKMTPKERATFNLLMIESGWAATFPIYPSLPKYSDLKLLHEVAQEAYDLKKGIWAEPLTLAGYEYRMCIKLYEITKKIVNGQKMSSSERNAWITRYCADMTTQAIGYPQEYCNILPYNRIFIWPEDVNEAVAKMNLVPDQK